MIAFGIAGIALCLGVFLRAKIGFLRNMLVPASVIAGILGMIFMNVTAELGINIGTDSEMFTQIVNHLFTISLSLIHIFLKGETSALCDGTQIGLKLVTGHTNAVIADSQNAVVPISGNGDMEVGTLYTCITGLQTLIVQFVQGVAGIAYQFPQEYLLVGVN